MEKTLKFAVFGAGFWANYQISAWKQVGGVELLAICDPDEEKAKKMAEKHGIPNVYRDAGTLFKQEKLDFVDIISSIPSHAPLVMAAAKAGVHVICQKPMAEDYKTCQAMVKACEDAGVKYFIHENFRFQTPIRKCKQLMEQGEIGNPFKARLTFCSGFPVFDNQPALAELDRFIIMDLGVHILDMSRYLFGDVEKLYCQTQKINPSIKGEDVATTLLSMKSGVNCLVEVSYASQLEQETFPQTLMLLEGDKGSIRLDYNHHITVTRKGKGSEKIQADPPQYDWADPDYALIHSSVVTCNQSILDDLQDKAAAENSGQDNLKTMELVFLSYKSSETNKVLYTT
ncbi:Gfo/Idh/MocA family protein [Pleomorphovibrio marinus]|uniref:Gfo/Idh/MocA family protein n=1 Tax=Pleomorphovibrio marinus TaxID=2164132 RepID=UPI000E0C53DE|nr:Gfo/Idh/MocA family oxidoreductase [Pleomorphovibrio marinus]